MKKTVLVVAHNEEENIDRCLKSVSKQNPDELVVVCHNCTDRTREIARQYSQAKVIDYKGPRGVVYARIEGFKHVSNEIVACIDGDSWSASGWLKNLTKGLENKDVVATGGMVFFLNSFSASMMGLGFFILSPLFKRNFKFYFWGMNFACRKSDYENVGGFEGLLTIKRKLKLYFWSDDLYLSLLLEKIGRVALARKAVVFAEAKNHFIPDGIDRGEANDRDRKKLFEYFQKK